MSYVRPITSKRTAARLADAVAEPGGEHVVVGVSSARPRSSARRKRGGSPTACPKRSRQDAQSRKVFYCGQLGRRRRRARRHRRGAGRQRGHPVRGPHGSTATSYGERRSRQRPRTWRPRSPKKSPENRPESLSSFQAMYWPRAGQRRSPCKCTRSSESNSAPERIRTSDLGSVGRRSIQLSYGRRGTDSLATVPWHT